MFQLTLFAQGIPGCCDQESSLHFKRSRLTIEDCRWVQKNRYWYCCQVIESL